MNALSRTVPYVNIEKRHTLFNTSFISQFNYRPLIYMCHSSAKRTKKLDKINRIYNVKITAFKLLLEKGSYVSLFKYEIFGFLL